jgi:hypothetical protein
VTMRPGMRGLRGRFAELDQRAGVWISGGQFARFSAFSGVDPRLVLGLGSAA